MSKRTIMNFVSDKSFFISDKCLLVTLNDIELVSSIHSYLEHKEACFVSGGCDNQGQNLHWPSSIDESFVYVRWV